MNVVIPSLALVQFIDETPTSLQLGQVEILKLEEQREKAKAIHAHHQKIVKTSFDTSCTSSKKN